MRRLFFIPGLEKRYVALGLDSRRSWTPRGHFWIGNTLHLLAPLEPARPACPVPASRRPVLPDGCLGFRFDRLEFSFCRAFGESFVTVSTMLWGLRETVVSWANRPAGAPFYPVQPRLAAPLPHRALPRPNVSVVCPGFAFERLRVRR